MLLRTHVDLFSGIGGFALACRWAKVCTVAFSEIDNYASKVLVKNFPGVPNYGDVRDVPAVKSVWLVTGGIPCQPASVAGKRQGPTDDRWLWPEAIAAVERIRPAWVLFENPTGILSLNNGLEFERICLALESQGYEVQPLIIPACAVEAPHRRDRVWIIANSKTQRCEGYGAATHTGSAQRWGEASRLDESVSEPTINTQRIGWNTRQHESENADDWEGKRKSSPATSTYEFRGWDEFPTQPAFLARDDGVSGAVDRIRCLGNAIVPQVAYALIKRMIEAEDAHV